MADETKPVGQRINEVHAHVQQLVGLSVPAYAQEGHALSLAAARAEMAKLQRERDAQTDPKFLYQRYPEKLGKCQQRAKRLGKELQEVRGYIRLGQAKAEQREAAQAEAEKQATVGC